MAKSETPNTGNEVSIPTDDQLPAFMQQDERIGVDELSKFIRPPRIKVVQPTSHEDFSEFEAGTVLALPTKTVIASMLDKRVSQTFTFVPIFFWVEWCQMNPRSMRDKPALRERTFDPSHPIAIKSRVPETREEMVEGLSKPITNEEHLNFIIALYGMPEHPLNMQPMVLNFNRSEHNSGTSFNSLVRMRKASIFGNVFEAHSKYRTNAQGNWFGIDIDNPHGPKYVQDNDAYEAFKALHHEMFEAHAEDRLQVDHDEPTAAPADGAQEGADF